MGEMLSKKTFFTEKKAAGQIIFNIYVTEAEIFPHGLLAAVSVAGGLFIGCITKKIVFKSINGAIL